MVVDEPSFLVVRWFGFMAFPSFLPSRLLHEIQV